MNKKNMTLRQLTAGALAALGVFGTAVSQAGTTTAFSYDAVGQVTSVTSPSGRTKTLQWDAFGRNVSQSVNGASTGYGYNYQNALTAVQDPKGLTTSYDRNGFGETKTLTSPDTGPSNYSYDANGNLTSRVNAAGQVESYTYDAADRVVTKTVSHPAGGSITYTFSYGTAGVEAGRLVQVTASGLTLTYSHNILGQVTSASQAISGSPTLTTSYGYAANGALTSITYPSGRVVSMGLDSASRPSSMTSGSANLLTGIGYTPLGAIAGWTFGSGQAVARTFDGAGRVASVTMPWGARVYSYDNEDRITAISDGALGSATYGYDGFDRLTSATTALGAWTYGYDANGNRTSNSVNGLGYGVAVDAGSNRVSGYITQSGYGRLVDYSADGHAAQVSGGSPQVACGTAVTLGYQADGQLATSNVLTAVNAPNGLRLQKTAAACAGGTKTNFIYDLAGHLIGEYDATGAPIQETAWLGDLPVAVFKALGGVVSNFNVYADNLGTPRVITSTAGQVVWGWDGEPFGASPANQNPNNLGDFAYGLRFPGQYFDVETGYHHNGWREYEPALGRYVQSDPIGLAAGSNTYAYVVSNPLGAVDTLGLKTLNLVPKNDSLWENGEHFAKHDDTDPNKFVVFSHGSQNTLNHMTDPATIMEVFKQNGYKDGMEIVLMACNTAKGGANSLAAKLAKYAKAKVTATPDLQLGLPFGRDIGPAQELPASSALAQAYLMVVYGPLTATYRARFTPDYPVAVPFTGRTVVFDGTKQ